MKSEIVNIINKYTDIVGFVSTSTYQEERSKIKMHDHFTDYAFLSDYKTIITLGFPYPKEEVKWQGKGYGIFARFSYSNDYHVVIGKILDKIVQELKFIGINGYGSVDVSKVDEKFAAKLSGIGYFGKNSIIINPQYGNYMFLATILIDNEVDSGNILEMDCGDCRLCIDACPSNALEYGIDKTKCISYLSQTKIPLNETEISYFKTVIYGCDICLKVCPKNKDIDIHKYTEFEPDGIENVKLEEVLLLSNKGFKEKFGYNTSHWIGASTFKRNALCLIANQKLTNLTPKIRKSMDVYHDNLWYNKTAELVLKVLERE